MWIPAIFYATKALRCAVTYWFLARYTDGVCGHFRTFLKAQEHSPSGGGKGQNEREARMQTSWKAWMKTHLPNVGRYRGETAHLPKEGCVINPLSIRYLIFVAAEVSYFIFVVLQKNLIRLCIIYKTFAAIGIR